ncbi:MAG: glycosyltransferase [Anaerolineae bacterium]|nr:glycosyltransferase [Anaerolineae bacterium]
MRRKINLSILTRSLGSGGAERQLIELLRQLDKQTFNVVVLLFYAKGDLISDFRDIENIDIVDLAKKSRWDFFGFVRELVRQINKNQSEIIYGYLDVPNIFAILAGKTARKKVVYGVRSSHVDFSRYDWTAGIVYRIEAFLSRFADQIIVNSQTGLDYHRSRGFAPQKMRVIPNGIDAKRFRPNKILREQKRLAWGVSTQHILIGLVARLDPIKGHPIFLRMAAILNNQFPQVRFVCVGDGADDYWQEMRLMANTLGLASSLVWAGSCTEMPSVYCALDIFVSASFGEGFSNVIGEAMACEIPCVVTNVGDSAHIVGNTGRVVAPNDPESLAAAVSEFLEMSAETRAALGRQARKRIQEKFSVEKMVAATEKTFKELADETA